MSVPKKSGLLVGLVWLTNDMRPTAPEGSCKRFEGNKERAVRHQSYTCSHHRRKMAFKRTGTEPRMQVCRKKQLQNRYGDIIT